MCLSTIMQNFRLVTAQCSTRVIVRLGALMAQVPCFAPLLPQWEGNGNPLQYLCLEKPMDRGAWWATVPGFAKSHHCATHTSLSPAATPAPREGGTEAAVRRAVSRAGAEPVGAGTGGN